MPLIRRRFGIANRPDHVGRFLHTRLAGPARSRNGGSGTRRPDIDRWKRDESHASSASAASATSRSSTNQAFPAGGGTPHLGAGGRNTGAAFWDRRDRIWDYRHHRQPGPSALALCFQLLPTNTNAKAPDVVDFLRHLKATLGGPITVVWIDGIHRKAGLVQAYLAEHPEIVTEASPATRRSGTRTSSVELDQKALADRPADNTDWLFDHLVGP